MLGGIGVPEILVLIVIVMMSSLPIALLIGVAIIVKRASSHQGAIESRLEALEAASMAEREDVG